MQAKYLLLPCLAFGIALANVVDAGNTSCKDDTVKAPISSVGTWVRNDQLSFNLPHPVASETVFIRRADTITDYSWTGIDADGHKYSFTFKGPVDGTLIPMTGDFAGTKVATVPTLIDGVAEGKIISKDGSSESKYCIRTSMTRLTCYATYIDAAGKQSLFREIFDKVK